MSLVYLAVVAALAAIEAPTQKQEPVVVEVRIVVAPRAALETQCAAGKFSAVDVLVDENEAVNEPYHCPPNRKELIAHKIAHTDKQTLVRLSYARQDTVRWESDREFSIAKIALREVPKIKEGIPTTPFGKLGLPTKPSKSLSAGPITSKASVGYQYKIYLTIGKRTIDPDVWCDP